MPKKGCPPDNSACEGFFGRTKPELFYGRDWRGVAMDEFMRTLDGHLHRHNGTRAKESLGWTGPLDYRRGPGLAAQGKGALQRRPKNPSSYLTDSTAIANLQSM